MVVIADGDLIRNELGHEETQDRWPTAIWLGMRASRIMRPEQSSSIPVYGNGIFFTNLMDRMMGNEHLISLRSRMKIVRLLNAGGGFPKQKVMADV